MIFHYFGFYYVTCPQPLDLIALCMWHIQKARVKYRVRGISCVLKVADFEDILCLLVEFCLLYEIHAPKTRFKQISENLRLNVYARMFWEPV